MSVMSSYVVIQGPSHMAKTKRKIFDSSIPMPQACKDLMWLCLQKKKDKLHFKLRKVGHVSSALGK